MLVALLLVTSALGPVGTVSAQSVTIAQSTTTTTVAPGGTVTVEATVDYSDVNSPGIDVTLPDGWAVTSHTDDGGTYGVPKPAWAWLEGDADGVSGSHTVTYTVQVPDDAAPGQYTLSAEGSGLVPADSTRVTDTDDLTITVEEPTTNQPPTADAGSNQTVTSGDSVQLDASGSSDPDGDALSYQWSQTAGPSVSLSDASAAQPTFTAPDVSAETTLTFQVEVSDGDLTATDTVTVTVQPTAPPAEPTVTFTQTATSPTTVEPGETVSVEATVDYADVNAPVIDVTLPDGWTVTSHTDDGGQYGPPEPAWVWQTGDADGVSGSHTVTYTVQVPDGAANGQYTIAGEGSAVDPADGSDVVATDDLTVTVSQNQPPTAAFSFSPSTPEPGEVVSFDASGSSDADGSIESYAWSFGAQDEPTTTGATPSNTFDTEGTYQVSLTVTDDDGATDTVTQAVTVEAPANQDPTAAFSFSPSDPQVGEQVSFDASGSSDADGSVASYEWSFGDDASATGAAPTHTYDEAGTYTVLVTVTDDDGATATTSQQVTVSEAPNQGPTAAFSYAPSDPQVDETVTFDAGSSSDADGAIASYEWTIGAPASGGTTTLLESGFEADSLAATDWTHDDISGTASAGVSGATSNTGSQSAFHYGGEGALVSPALDAGGATSVTVDFWVQKGAEEFSENPDAGAGEDLVVEYLDADGNWVELTRIEDTVDPGATVSESPTVSDAAALHDGFQIRFRQQGASVATGDYWHVDDVSVTATAGADGGVTETGETVTHAFATTGEHEVTLTVTDDDGATDTATQTVVVEAVDEAMPVPEAVASLDDAGDDSTIETSEMQQAIDLWVGNDPVPGTGGETISTTELQQLVDMWVEDELVGDNGGGT